MSAECEKHGTDLHGNTITGLICPSCEHEKDIAGLQAELESERTARREADENRFALWQGEHDQRNRAIAAEQKVAALIAAVEKHEREEQCLPDCVTGYDEKLWRRVRFISGDSE